MRVSKKLKRRAQKRANKKGRPFHVIDNGGSHQLISDKRFKGSMKAVYTCDPDEGDSRSGRDKTKTSSTRAV